MTRALVAGRLWPLRERMPGAYLVLAGIFGAAPWLLRSVRPLAVAAAIVAALAVVVAGVAAGLHAYPWSDLPETVIAVGGGSLLGRALPPRRAPLAALLVVLSVLDSIQLLLPAPPGSGSAAATVGAEPAWWWWTMFVVATPWHTSAIGVFDLLLVGAISEHARQRAAGRIQALAPGPLGLGVADATTPFLGIGLPLVPFLTLGWLVSEAWMGAARRLSPRSRR